MSVWIPILTGLLAFVGAIAGHFVAFDLNSAAKRREVRRTQIERFAEFISEDQTWMNNYRNEALFGQGNFQPGTSPRDKAFAVYRIYFAAELANTMNAFVQARYEFEAAIDAGYLARLQTVGATGQSLSITVLPRGEIDLIMAKYRPYYQGIVDNLDAASTIIQETIPEESQMARWCADSWARLRDLSARKT